jgi:hypothetical protein
MPSQQFKPENLQVAGTCSRTSRRLQSCGPIRPYKSSQVILALIEAALTLLSLVDFNGAHWKEKSNRSIICSAARKTLQSGHELEKNSEMNLDFCFSLALGFSLASSVASCCCQLDYCHKNIIRRTRASRRTPVWRGPSAPGATGSRT